MPPQPPSPVVSSSSTLWATASKEWVIPAKPKPGRKPKKDLAPAPAQQSDVVDANGRRVQNRAAQRAFRERKQSQLAELQARIQLYEQGEIERNVALQATAKRLKEENDRLRAENEQHKETIANCERNHQALKPDENKRWRNSPSIRLDDHDPSNNPPKRNLSSIPAKLLPLSSPSSNISSENGPSPLPTQNPGQADVMFPSPVTALETIFNFPPGTKTSAYSGTHSMGDFECGLCTGCTPCVCRDMVLNPPATPFKTETTTVSAASMVPVELPPASQIEAQSILDNLPPYQPPVPLRRRPEVRPLRSLFPVVLSSGSPSQVTRSGPVGCSGDPSNCLACADDVFGQAFCAAVGESLACSGPCVDCPRASGTKYRDSTHASSSASQVDGNPAETIPTSDAWRQLKSHPNVSFADLTLLAEVVARRSKCAGPTVVISPPPGSITPERTSSPARPMNDPSAGGGSDVILLSDPHANYHMKERERSACSSPNLVQEELVRCSRTQSVREVHTAGVREALALLDSRF
ncbi:hypothetical protein BGY98DRAFT_1105024 [Russula aff. rugulosa BPL654]|nr:hypothetical protein BGY98DRAFT_1105024 [Russula aff. rugulosa BPL654]